MKKKIITFITTMSILASGAVNVKAATSLEEKYKQAYDKTMSVVAIAQKYEVKPFYREGSSTLSSVVKAVDDGNLQKEILLAREYINALPASIQLSKNTLSSILDDYQHPIYEKIVKVATQTKGFLTPELERIDETTNLLCIENGEPSVMLYDRTLNRFDCMDILARNMHSGKILIQDVPEPLKSSYSSALDESKQKILNWYSGLVKLIEKTKNEALKDSALYLLNNEKLRSTNGTGIVNYINLLIERVNKVEVKPGLTKEEIIKYALENGFTEVTDFSKLSDGLYNIAQDSNVKQVFIKKGNTSELACIVWNNEVELYSKDMNLAGAVDFIKSIAPNEADKIITSVNTADDKGFLTSNGLMCMCSFDYKYKYIIVGFRAFR